MKQLQDAPAGLSYWLWDAGPRRNLELALKEVTRSSGRPVLVEGYSPDGIGDEGSQAQVAADLTRTIFASPALLLPLGSNVIESS